MKKTVKTNEANNKMHVVNHLSVKKGMSVNELVKAMEGVGVLGSKRIATACNIMEAMIKDKDCTVFLGCAGPLVPGGMKNILIDMMEKKLVDVFVTTGATLTHDMAEALGYHHFQGSAAVDDAELNKKHIDRIYDSYMPNDVYEGIEDFFNKHLVAFEKQMNIREFTEKIGELLPAGKKSILKTAYEQKIPIFCPALADSGIGLMIWGLLAKGKKINVDAFDDLKDILNIAWDCKKAGVIYVGGGVPKNYIQQAMQFCPKGSSYGVQITTDREEFGGSSGAPLKEGISWGKMEYQAKRVEVICDATIALPLLYAAVLERI